MHPARAAVLGRDHPRSRGVYWPRRSSALRRRGSSPLARGLLATKPAIGAIPGSSPLARGLLQEYEPGGAIGRIIPARAGFTLRRHAQGRHGPDHPRSRGVYTRKLKPGAALIGSSPLARGLRGPRSACPGRSRDHPRSRGVYCAGRSPPRPDPGSSPLARGLRGIRPRDRHLGGIIPARAGFTPGRRPTPGRPADHPRSRGVYEKGAHHEANRPGSSPLARGLPAGPHLSAGRRGIIPARAGFTPPTHICLSGARIIPARAGFTVGVVVSPHGETDHPRSRGVYLTFFVSGAPAAGSSPLARGLPRQGERRWEHRGIIPARAGFTR